MIGNSPVLGPFETEKGTEVCLVLSRLSSWLSLKERENHTHLQRALLAAAMETWRLHSSPQPRVCETPGIERRHRVLDAQTPLSSGLQDCARANAHPALGEGGPDEQDSASIICRRIPGQLFSSGLVLGLASSSLGEARGAWQASLDWNKPQTMGEDGRPCLSS